MTAASPPADIRLTSRRLGRAGTTLALVGGVALAFLLFAVTPLQGRAELTLVSVVLAGIGLYVASRLVEGRRAAANRMATFAAVAAFVVAMIPLVAVLGFTIAKGAKRISGGFLSHSMAGVGPLSPGGGVYHAIIGTVEQVLLAGLISVPLGILVAVYTTEYGTGTMAALTRYLVDVMTGLPSIVAGLFVFAFWVIGLHQGFSGFAGSLALAVLMLPIVVRASEEMIRLVPGSLREASLALGVPKWRTILSVVLPTASTGITTGVMLAVARVTGETAPLLLTVGNNAFINNNPFKGLQSALSLFVFDQAGSAFQVDIDRAWAAALTLIAIVVILYVLARLLTRRNALARR